MDDLEAQLRRYADHVEAAVGDVALPADSSRPASTLRRVWIVAAAASVLVAVVAISIALRGGADGEHPADQPDLVVDEPTTSTTEAPAPAVTTPTTTTVEASTTTFPIDDGLRVPIPDVEGLFADSAIRALRDIGLEPVPILEAVPMGSQLAGRVLAVDPSGGTLVAPDSVVSVTVGEASVDVVGPPAPSRRQAARAVADFLDLTAAGEWELAARHLVNEGWHERVLTGLGLEEHEIDQIPDALQRYCESALCDAAYELGKLRQANSVRAIAALEVTFADVTGELVVEIPVGIFEGDVTLGALPPPGLAASAMPSVSERLFGSSRPSSELAVVRSRHIEWVDGGSTEYVGSWFHRNGGSVGALDDHVVLDSGVLVDRAGSDDEGLGDADLAGIGAGLVFGTQGTTATGYSVSGDQSPLVLTLNPERFDSYGTYGIEYVSMAGDATLLTVGLGLENTLLFRGPGDEGHELILNRIVAGARLAPDAQTAAALSSPGIGARFTSVVIFDPWDRTEGGAYPAGSQLAAFDLPIVESFVGTLDFDGRWVLAPLESGRVFVVDTAAETAQVVDVYAEVWFND